MTVVEVPEAALDEARAFNTGLERLLAAGPAVHTLTPQDNRRRREAGEGPFGPIVRSERAASRVVEHRGGQVKLRTVSAEHPTAAYLHIHGGGWTLGGSDQQDLQLEALADRAGLAVFSVEYRLAPEHPYPAGPDDCELAALWLLERGAAEAGVSRLMIGGESAGAHLSAVTLLRLRDRHGITGAFAAANLVFGIYDVGLTPSARRWGDRYFVLSTPAMEWFADQFLPGLDTAARQQPDVSPLFADLAGMPPALLSVGALDPLVDDSLFMAARWAAAGSAASVEVYPESPHGFTAYPTPIASAAREAQARFLSGSPL